jgi:hypothetical protein
MFTQDYPLGGMIEPYDIRREEELLLNLPAWNHPKAPNSTAEKSS